jgi:hypothetical protein
MYYLCGLYFLNAWVGFIMDCVPSLVKEAPEFFNQLSVAVAAEFAKLLIVGFLVWVGRRAYELLINPEPSQATGNAWLMYVISYLFMFSGIILLFVFVQMPSLDDEKAASYIFQTMVLAVFMPIFYPFALRTRFIRRQIGQGAPSDHFLAGILVFMLGAAYFLIGLLIAFTPLILLARVSRF